MDLPARTLLRACTGGALALGLLATAAAQPAAAEPARRGGQVVLLLSGTGTAVGAAHRDARAEGARTRHELAALGAVSVGVPAARAAAVRRTLSGRPGLTVVDVPKRTLSAAPNDTEYPAQQAYLEQVRAPAAWDVSHGDASVRIAVVDTGVTTSHPDLAGKVVGQFNAVEGTSDVTDTIGHGTAVAGVAAAATDNAAGVAGTGWSSSLLAVKVADSDGNVWADDEVAGIVWAADHGARVVNLSLGGEQSLQAEADAVAYAQSKGALVVAAAGNDASTTPNYPAAYPGVVAVGATDPGTGHVAGFSNHGSWVTLAAPGAGILSTSGADGYEAVSGTSFSSPLVAGAAALIAGHRPTATATQLRAALVASAQALPGDDLGAGLLDMAAALAHLPPTSVPSFTAPTAGQTVQGRAPVSVSSTASQVQLSVDGAARGGRVDPASPGLVLDTLGLANGAHSFGAADCNAYGCGTPATVSVQVDNPAPVITSPAVVSGAATLTATAPAGSGLRFLVDGVSRGFDASSPYALALNTSTLTNGTHTLKVVECNAAGTACAGPSATQALTVRSLHPTIVAATSPFSPNGDGRRDTSRWVLRLPDTEKVSYRITNAAGTTVVGPSSWVSRTKGDYAFTWTGKSPTGATRANGVYTITVSTTAVVNGTTVRGKATRAVRLDTVAPGLSSVVGSKGSVFPVVDGYRDTVKLGVTVSEGATVSVRVRNSAGTVVRTLATSRTSAGAVAVAWNGRTSGGSAVPAGAYTFSFLASDGALNRRTSSSYTLTVSWKKLVSRTATLTLAGSDAVGAYAASEYADGTPAGCAEAEVVGEAMVLRNNCADTGDAPTVGLAGAGYAFTVPAALSYTSLRADVYGYAANMPSTLIGTAYNYATDLLDSERTTSMGPYQEWTAGVCRPAVAHHVRDRVVRIALFLDQNPYGAADYVIWDVRLVVGYKVLV